MTKDSLLIAVTGGGTGGHVEPVRAVIEELRKQPVQLYWIGSHHGPESHAAHELEIPFMSIRVGKIRRYVAWANVSDMINVAIGYVQCLWIFVRKRPEVLFSKAGYVSVPALLAAATLRIPVVAHESDTVIGLANHIASMVAKRFCTGFALPFYGPRHSQKMVFTGNPVRVVEPQSPIELIKDVPVVVVFGGSQGSATLNTLLWDILPKLLKVTQVVHQVGPEHEEGAATKSRSLEPTLAKRYHSGGYFDRANLSYILSHASVAISRAGANAIADLSYFSVPTILIPLPSASADHQTINAQYVVERGAAVLLHQVDANSTKLYDTIENLLDNAAKRKAMAEAMHAINPPDAAAHIAGEILNVAKGQK